MTAALLDVNVLVALFDPLHINHEDAHLWFASHGRRRWATCAITINGCIRVLSNPDYPSLTATPLQVVQRLRMLCARQNHEFWPEGISLLDEARLHWERITGHRQLTDVYLLSLAVARDAQLVTFDRSVPWQAVVGAKASDLRILGAA